jgi:hypothetical protein
MAKPSIIDTAGPPGILGTMAGFVSCAIARTLNRLCADPLPNNAVARILRRWGAGTWPWERLAWGEFTAYAAGLAATIAAFWWLIS